MAEIYLTEGGVETPYDFSGNRSLTTAELLRLDDPCVLFEGTRRDSDGVSANLYTVGGYLDGQGLWPGCTVEGDVMIVHANSKGEANEMAAAGLDETIATLRDMLRSGVDQTTNSGILSSAGIRGRSH